MRVMSVFSGVGGLDMLFHDNFQIVGFSEVDESASNVLKRHYPDIPNFGDITKIQQLPEFDILVGGSPCQNLSTQGKQEGLSGAKSSLFFEYVRLLRENRPKYFVFENVKNLLYVNKGHDFETVKKEFQDLGYHIQWTLVDSSKFGTSQQRIRLFVLGSLEPLGEDCLLDEYKKYTQNCTTEKYISWSKSTRKNGIEVRIRQDGLVNTLTTGLGCVGMSTGTLNMDGTKLSPEQCEELMGWPRGWTAGEPDSKRYKMCGNGVVSTCVKPIIDIINMNNFKTGDIVITEENEIYEFVEFGICWITLYNKKTHVFYVTTKEIRLATELEILLYGF